MRSDGWCRDKLLCDSSGPLLIFCSDDQPRTECPYTTECPGLDDLCWICNGKKKGTFVMFSHWDFVVVTTAYIHPILTEMPILKKHVAWNISNWRSCEEILSAVKLSLRKMSPLRFTLHFSVMKGLEKSYNKENLLSLYNPVFYTLSWLYALTIYWFIYLFKNICYYILRHLLGHMVQCHTIGLAMVISMLDSTFLWDFTIRPGKNTKYCALCCRVKVFVVAVFLWINAACYSTPGPKTQTLR